MYRNGDLVMITGRHNSAGAIGIVDIDPSYRDTDGVDMGGVHTRIDKGQAFRLAGPDDAVKWLLRNAHPVQFRTEVYLEGIRHDAGNYVLVKLPSQAEVERGW